MHFADEPRAGRDALRALALTLAVLLASAWMRPLMLPDEGRYVGVAWEMLQSGDWLVPRLDGLPFFHKPPLFYWISGAALALLGPLEIAGRAGSLAGATLAAMALFLFTRRWGGPAAAWRALVVLLVQPLFFLGAQFANLDMLVAGCISATVLALAHAALAFEQGLPYRRALWLGYTLAGLGVLAKGLIGFVLPAMAIGVWLLALRRWRTLAALLSLSGALLFLLVAAPWFVVMQQRFDGFLHYFFVVQHFQRFADSGFNNAMPVWFYPAVLVLASLPCLAWSGRLATPGYWRGAAGTPAGAVRLAMLLALVSVVLFFSLPRSKLVGYVLPAVVPLAWLMADASAPLAAASRVRARLWRASLLLSLMIGLAVVLWLVRDTRHSQRAVGEALRDLRQPGEPVLVLGSYLYDLPFHARLRAPVQVVDDWDAPEVRQRDNWRKELADAGDFEPAAARRILLRPARLTATLCAVPASWVLGTAGQAAPYPWLARLPAAQRVGDVLLWRVQPGDLPASACAAQ